MAIPKNIGKPLAILVRFSKPEYERFLGAAKEVGPMLKVERFSDRVAEKAGLNRDELRQIFTTLAAMYIACEETEMPVPQLLDFIIPDLEAAEIKPQDSNWDLFRHSLVELLSAESPFTITTKSLQIFTAHERVYSSARILTDMRPVFAANPADGPKASVTFHMLQLNFRERGRENGLFFALDTNDVQQLRNVLDRALAKELSLLQFCEKGGVPVISKDYDSK